MSSIWAADIVQGIYQDPHAASPAASAQRHQVLHVSRRLADLGGLAIPGEFPCTTSNQGAAYAWVDWSITRIQSWSQHRILSSLACTLDLWTSEVLQQNEHCSDSGSPIVQLLQLRDIRLHMYLDYWLIWVDSPSQASVSICSGTVDSRYLQNSRARVKGFSRCLALSHDGHDSQIQAHRPTLRLWCLQLSNSMRQTADIIINDDYTDSPCKCFQFH